MSSSEPSKRTMDIVDTELPADSVEFCPRDGSRNILVCGTYNLVKNDQGDADSPGSKQPQTRDGRCLVYEVGETSQTLKEVHRIETAAILDLKWQVNIPSDLKLFLTQTHRSYDNISSNPILAVAESVGSIRIYEWHQQEKKLSASQVIQVGDPHTLCLSIDWNNRVSYQGGHRLIVSKSDGGLSVLKPSESRMEVELVWHAHDFEPWIAAWNYWTPQVAYSGGDDCKLKGWDTRTSCDSPIFVNRRFEAGVTCIQTHPYVEHVVAVGSYDNTVRIFDSRKMSAPVADVDVGGGAWRVKWHPSVSRKEDLLVACMHDGFKVVRCPIKDSTAAGMIDPPVTTSFYNAHTSLAYGIDWKHGLLPDGSPESMIASCSFYDHVLHLWSS